MSWKNGHGWQENGLFKSKFDTGIYKKIYILKSDFIFL